MNNRYNATNIMQKIMIWWTQNLMFNKHK